MSDEIITGCDESCYLMRTNCENHVNPFFHDETMEKLFSFLADRSRAQMRFLLSFSDVLYFNIGSMRSPSHRPWASASHYSVSIYCSINSPDSLQFSHLFSGEAEKCSGRDMLIMWNVACWFKFSSLVQRHLTAVFFSVFFLGSLWFGFNLLDKGCEV